MSRVRLILLGLLVVVFAACGKTNKQTTEPPPQPAVQQPVAQPAPPQPAPESAPAPQVTQPEPAKAVAPAQQPSRPAKRAPAKKARIEQAASPARVTQEQQPAQGTPVSSTAAGRADSAPSPLQQSQPVQPPKPPEPKFAMIPSGTSLHVRLQDSLDSGVNKAGDTFRAILDQDIEVDGKVIAARGSLLQGKLSQVAQSGRVEGRASMTLQLVSLSVANQTYPIQTGFLSFEAESTKKKDATKVGLGAGIGAVIGAIAGGGKGAAIGAAVGGGAGGATVLATRGKEVQLEPEHKLDFALTRDVSVKLQ